MKVVATERIPIKLWLENIEDGALEQALHLANLPFAYKHIAVMPDAHVGYGMPIGGVMATQGVVVPNAVGVDIGCGMIAVDTGVEPPETPELKKIMGEIRERIPVGFNHHKEPSFVELMPDLPLGKVSEEQFESALCQLGTLGGGNHFIELQVENNRLWVMIHSGSRNIGLKVANYYNKLAVQLNDRWFSIVPKKWELAYLPIDSDEGQAYLSEMDYCLEFARLNRAVMMLWVMEILGAHLGAREVASVNIHHNYARFEHHFGKNVVIHRKGATSAKQGEWGIIPGSMGTSSYIVKGLGNPDSFMSCSHGAGRRMGRKQAKRELSLEDELVKMEGVVHGMRNAGDLDEAPGAYKDIAEVLSQERDLVEPVVELKPIAVIKG